MWRYNSVEFYLLVVWSVLYNWFSALRVIMTVSFFITGLEACRQPEQRPIATRSLQHGRDGIMRIRCVQATTSKWWNGKSETVIRPGGGPAVRAALFVNVSSPVSAVLPLLFPPPFRSSFFCFFYLFFFCVCQSCPEPRVGKDLHLHITTLFSFVDCHRSSAWHLVWCWSVRAGVPSLSPSFIHAYTYVRSCLRLGV